MFMWLLCGVQVGWYFQQPHLLTEAFAHEFRTEVVSFLEEVIPLWGQGVVVIIFVN